MEKEATRLQVGVLGCGQISQSAHFESCRRGRNTHLYAICDLAEDLRKRMVLLHRPEKAYSDYDQMLNDPKLDAVIVGVADQYHVPLAKKAIEAGKPVLLEKPMGVTLAECIELQQLVQEKGVFLQLGNMKRFDPGIAYAHRFIQDKMGERMAVKAWYCDSLYRYSVTDNVQPLVEASEQSRRPEGNPKAEKRRYYILGHASHLLDTARFLGGDIESVRTRLVEKFDAYGWFIEADFADGAAGQFDLTLPIRGNHHEGFQVYGEFGSAFGKIHLPWLYTSAEVECFSTEDRSFYRPLGEDAHFYKLQLEGFADTVLHGKKTQAATADDGVANMRAMIAVARSSETGDKVNLAQVSGAV